MADARLERVVEAYLNSQKGLYSLEKETRFYPVSFNYLKFFREGVEFLMRALREPDGDVKDSLFDEALKRFSDLNLDSHEYVAGCMLSEASDCVGELEVSDSCRALLQEARMRYSLGRQASESDLDESLFQFRESMHYSRKAVLEARSGLSGRSLSRRPEGDCSLSGGERRRFLSAASMIKEVLGGGGRIRDCDFACVDLGLSDAGSWIMGKAGSKFFYLREK